MFNNWNPFAPKPHSFKKGLFVEQSDQLILRVAGLAYKENSALLPNYRLGDCLKIEPDPQNPKDENALKVMDARGNQVGFIERTMAARLAPALRKEPHASLYVKITELHRDADGSCGGMKLSFMCSAQVYDAFLNKLFIDFRIEQGEEGYLRLLMECSDNAFLAVYKRLLQRGIKPDHRGTSYKLAEDGRLYDRYLRIPSEHSEESILEFFKEEFDSVPQERKNEEFLDQLVEEQQHEKETYEQSNDELQKENISLRKQLQAKTRKANENDRLKSAAAFLHEKFPELIQLMLPSTEFEGNSFDVLTKELTDQSSLLGLLTSLNRDKQLPNSKRVAGTKWLELRFSSGQSNDGRLYFHIEDDSVHVLIGKKQTQKKDIEYLKNSLN
jgi:hypothetical protein